MKSYILSIISALAILCMGVQTGLLKLKIWGLKEDVRAIDKTIKRRVSWEQMDV